MRPMLSTRPIAVLALVALLALLLVPFVPAGTGKVARADGDDKEWAESSKALEAAVAAKDAESLRSAIGRVAKDNSERAVKALLVAVFAARELDVYEALMDALGCMNDPKAIAFMVKQSRDFKAWAVRYLLVEALGSIDTPEAKRALVGAFEDKHESVQVVAIKTAKAKRRVEAIPGLIEILEKVEKEKKQNDSRIYTEAMRALEGITGERMSAAFEWRAWWQANEGKFQPPAGGGAVAGGGEGGGGEGEHEVLTRVRERGDQEFIEKLEKGDIIVIQDSDPPVGQNGVTFDHVEQVLEELKLPYTLIERKTFGKLELKPTSIVVFNCHNHDQNKLTEADFKRVNDFVAQGGYVFTSDWELRNVVEKGVPGYIGVGTTTGEHEFPIKPGKGAEKHPYLKDVFPENPLAQARFKWKIDDLSYTVKILSSSSTGAGRVVPLVESDALAGKYGTGIVACTFRHGKGAVLHVLSHFERQRDPKGDGFALQQLLVNFVVEKQKWRKSEMDKKGKGKGGKGGKP